MNAREAFQQTIDFLDHKIEQFTRLSIMLKEELKNWQEPKIPELSKSADPEAPAPEATKPSKNRSPDGTTRYTITKGQLLQAMSHTEGLTILSIVHKLASCFQGIIFTEKAVLWRLKKDSNTFTENEKGDRWIINTEE